MLHPTPTAETLPKTVSKSLFYFNVIYLYVINSASSYIFFKFSSENLMIYLSVFAKWGFEKSRIGQVFSGCFGDYAQDGMGPGIEQTLAGRILCWTVPYTSST